MRRNLRLEPGVIPLLKRLKTPFHRSDVAKHVYELLNFPETRIEALPERFHLTEKRHEEALTLPVLNPCASPTFPSSASNEYLYTALAPGQIRLLKLALLDPLEITADRSRSLVLPLACSMHIVTLEDRPKYDALSYTWGDPIGLHTSRDEIYSTEDWKEQGYLIVCEGREIHIGANLYTALLSIRFVLSLTSPEVTSKLEAAGYHLGAYLWIDALCINQKDLDERNSQVAIMHHIYSEAQHTLVWLGGQDKTVTPAMYAIATLNELNPLQENLIGADLTDEATYKLAGIPPISPETWAMLYAFANRAWFKRAWIVQEVTLARKTMVLCGLKMIDFPSLSNIFRRLDTLRWWDSIRGIVEPHILGARNKGYIGGRLSSNRAPLILFQSQRWPLFDPHVLTKISNTRGGFIADENRRVGAKPLPLSIILQQQRFTQATDPRDKIYAFLQLSAEFASPTTDPTWRERLLPDYRKPVTALYMDTAIFLMVNQNGLGFLSLIQDPSETKLEGLHSWVPDFSADGWPNSMDDGRPTPWTATSSLGNFLLRMPTPSGKLPVQGARIARIMEKLNYSVGDIPNWTELVGLDTISRIERPVMNDKLLEYYRNGDMSSWIQERRDPMVEEDILETPTEQSRVDVLWRTLLLDCFYGRHPAPSSCGEHFKEMIELNFCQVELNLLQAFADGDMEAWVQGKAALSDLHENWQRSLQLPLCHRTLWSEEFTTAVVELESMSPSQRTPEVFRIASARLIAEKFGGVIPSSAHLSGMNKVLSKMRQIATQRRLFIAFGELGFRAQLGYGPRSLSEDDEVWLLVGADVPFILRRTDEGEYRVIGEAYVHGVMHGEAAARVGKTKEILLQ